MSVSDLLKFQSWTHRSKIVHDNRKGEEIVSNLYMPFKIDDNFKISKKQY